MGNETDEEADLMRKNKLLMEAMAAQLKQTMLESMTEMMNENMKEIRDEIRQATGPSLESRSRLSRDEYKPRGYDQLERNRKHDVVIKDTPQQRRFERDKWSRDCSQPSETKLYPSTSSQKLHDSRRSHPSTGIVSTKKKPICTSKEKTVSNPLGGEKQFCLFSEKDKEALLQVMMDVEKQFKRSNTTRAAIETQHQEPVTTVSDLKDTEPESAAHVQEDQAKVSSPINQKEEQQVQDVMVPFIQSVVEEKKPKEPQADHVVMQLIVFDPCDFQKTFLRTFLIRPFVWSKAREVELSRHELDLHHVVFEPGGELWNHRNKIVLVEKKPAATTIDFGDLLPSGDKVLHVSAHQEFHYETNWGLLPTLSWIQQTRPHSKWLPDHQDITSLVKHVGWDQFQELLMSDWVRRVSRRIGIMSKASQMKELWVLQVS
ncbi:RNA-directed DNA polymerase [Raphanus sativus]|nr:RNA-directed DNA polymerase [Raphanus sativus]